MAYNQLLIGHTVSKIIVMKYLAPVRPKLVLKLKFQDLLKFGTCNISGMPISIFMSKGIFIKYLPPVGPILFTKLEVLRIY